MMQASKALRNLSLDPWYVAGISFLAWMPVFFLNFAERLTLKAVLALEAIYYASVVLLPPPERSFSRTSCLALRSRLRR